MRELFMVVGRKAHSARRANCGVISARSRAIAMSEPRFQGRAPGASCGDQLPSRHIKPTRGSHDLRSRFLVFCTEE